MQIMLDHAEIEKAIKQYVSTHAVTQPNANIQVSLRAGRGERNFTATIDILAAGAVAGAMGSAPKSAQGELPLNDPNAKPVRAMKAVKAAEPESNEAPAEVDESGSSDTPRASIFGNG